MNLNDNRLIIKTLKSGDQKVFSLVYASYYKPLCLFCSSYVSLEEAEEIVQDLMMYVWEKRELLVEDLSLKSFLFTSVRNRALNSITRSHITRQVYEEYQSQQLKSLPALDSCYGTEFLIPIWKPFILFLKNCKEYMLWVGINNWPIKKLLTSWRCRCRLSIIG